MNNIISYKGYIGTVEFSQEDGILFGRIAGITDIITYEGESVSDIVHDFHDAVDDYIEHCAAIGKRPDKPYSGKFTLRIDPAAHARLAVQAQAAGKSLNQYAADLLNQA